jgi:hypothetical protein
MVMGAALAMLAQPVLAFKETTVGGESNQSQPSQSAPLETPKTPDLPSKGLNLKVPELSIGKGTGTEVRIPGFGTVGVLPKLDFGLELLYGANEPNKGLPQEKIDQDDVQIRGTIKHRF